MAKNSNEPKIEKGIPIPTFRKSKKGYAALLRKLEVGDSVFFPDKISRSNVSQALGKGNYTCRAEGKGMRVWRTK